MDLFNPSQFFEYKPFTSLKLFFINSFFFAPRATGLMLGGKW